MSATSSSTLLAGAIALWSLACSGDRSEAGSQERRERQAAIDALDAAQEAREEHIEALVRCEATALANLLQIAAGTWRWEDLIANRPAIAVDRALYWESYTRTLAIRELPDEVFRCTEAEPRGARFRHELSTELSQDDNLASLSRLLADDRDAALKILDLIPVAPLRMALEPLAASEPAARRAVLEIDDLPVAYSLNESWRSWIESHASDEWTRIEQLLTVASGGLPAGIPDRPNGGSWAEIRRSASQQARSIVVDRADVPEPLRLRIRTLLTDSDPTIRRNAIRMVTAIRDPEALPRIREMAAEELDPKLRLAAIEAATQLGL